MLHSCDLFAKHDPCQIIRALQNFWRPIRISVSVCSPICPLNRVVPVVSRLFKLVSKFGLYIAIEEYRISLNKHAMRGNRKQTLTLV